MAEIRMISAKSALNRVRGELEFSWSLNPYRGCRHACAYCYARATHRFLDLGVGEDFERVLMVKQNIAELLGRELARPGFKRETVAVGTATDPYQPIEGRFRLTRRCLEHLAAARNPVVLITKGTLVWRDLDVLQRFAPDALTVLMSIPSVDPRVWRASEPHTPAPAQRLRAVERLSAAGIYVGVMMAPILPGISDDSAMLRETVTRAAQAGAHFVEAHLLRLADDIRPVYAEFLRRHRPDRIGDYERWYAEGALIGRDFSLEVIREVNRLAAEAGLKPRRVMRPPSPPSPQLQWAF